MHERHLAATAVSLCFVALAFGSDDPPSSTSPPVAPTQEATASPAPPVKAPPPAALVVDARTLLADYEANEVGADIKYKGKVLEITGKVGDIKKDLFDSVYVTVGTGKQWEIREVQAYFGDADIGRAASLTKGQAITIRGRCDGLMMNVQVKDATFVE